jgi:hypothetical protein
MKRGSNRSKEGHKSVRVDAGGIVSIGCLQYLVWSMMKLTTLGVIIRAVFELEIWLKRMNGRTFAKKILRRDCCDGKLQRWRRSH